MAAHAAPEVIQSAPYGEPADLWSLGVILYEIIALRRPFSDSNLAALAVSISSQPVDIAPLTASIYSRELWRLATSEALLHRDPAARLSLSGLAEGLDDVPEIPLSDSLRVADDAHCAPTVVDNASPSHGDAAEQTQQAVASKPCRVDHSSDARLLNELAASPRGDHSAPTLSVGESTVASSMLTSPRTDNLASPRAEESATLCQIIEASVGQVVPAAYLSFHELVGKGASAAVYKGTMAVPRNGETTQYLIAVKRFATPSNKKRLDAFLKEIRMMRLLDHKNLLKCIGVSVADGCIDLITPFMSRGSVYTWLHKECRGVPPPLHIALKILNETATGMVYLHGCSPRVIHRDLKSLNLLLTADLEVRVADFGVSREVEHTDAMSRAGTLQWVAPEVMLGQRYNHKCDVWSFGVVCWELLTALTPFDGVNPVELSKKVHVDGLRLPPPPGAPLPLLQLMGRCWRKPAGRPEFSQLLVDLEKIRGGGGDSGMPDPHSPGAGPSKV